ncbi:DUF456 domain-containing protein [Thermincola ferriacetica]
MEQVILWISVIIVIIGALGTILPVLPGAPLIFVTAILYGWYEGFNKITPLTLVAMFVLMALVMVIDYVSGSLGAKKYGATKSGIWGSLIGGVIGFMLFNVPGIILGPLVGAVIGEIIAGKNITEASKVGIGTLLGMAVGSAVKFSFAIAMAVLYITKVLS